MSTNPSLNNTPTSSTNLYLGPGIENADAVHDDTRMKDFFASLTHDFDYTDIFFSVVYMFIFLLMAFYCCFIRPVLRFCKKKRETPVDLDYLVKVKGYRVLKDAERM